MVPLRTISVTAYGVTMFVAMLRTPMTTVATFSDRDA